MLEMINKIGPVIELTTLFVVIMLSILIVAGWCMQPKKKIQKTTCQKESRKYRWQ